MVAELRSMLSPHYDPALLGFVLDEHDMSRWVRETGGDQETAESVVDENCRTCYDWLERPGEKYMVWMVRGLAGSPQRVFRWQLTDLLLRVEAAAYVRGWGHGNEQAIEGPEEDDDDETEGEAPPDRDSPGAADPDAGG